jgi:hypothetical protein
MMTDHRHRASFGATAAHTVFELSYADRFTTRLIVGRLAFPFEPFHLLGPALPPDWQDADPIPRVELPLLCIARHVRVPFSPFISYRGRK